MKPTKNPGHGHQNGAALIISMILLFVITLLTLSSVRNTNLDTKIAVNHQHKQMSFQAAESALFKLMSPVPNVLVPLTPESDVVVNENYFQSTGIDHQPDMDADLSIDFIRVSNRGEFKFNGFGLDLTTLVYQADAEGKITGGRARAHNRVGVVLIRN